MGYRNSETSASVGCSGASPHLVEEFAQMERHPLTLIRGGVRLMGLRPADRL